MPDMGLIATQAERAGWGYGDAAAHHSWFFRDFENRREEDHYLRSAEKFAENLERRHPGIRTTVNAQDSNYDPEGSGSVYIDVYPIAKAPPTEREEPGDDSR